MASFSDFGSNFGGGEGKGDSSAGAGSAGSTGASAPQVQLLSNATPLEVAATVSRVVTRCVDRITGDRVEVPLLVAAACVEALKNFGIQSRVMYGPSAWVEVLEDNTVVWAGCWGKNYSFWVATQYGEVVDLNVSAAYRKQSHQMLKIRSMVAPPMLWAVEVPVFYRYSPEGVAELELTDEGDQRRYEAVLREINEKCTPAALAEQKASGAEPEFPNEPILYGRKLLDDSHGTFKQFDRVVAIRGVPKAPF